MPAGGGHTSRDVRVKEQALLECIDLGGCTAAGREIADRWVASDASSRRRRLARRSSVNAQNNNEPGLRHRLPEQRLHGRRHLDQALHNNYNYYYNDTDDDDDDDNNSSAWSTSGESRTGTMMTPMPVMEYEFREQTWDCVKEKDEKYMK